MELASGDFHSVSERENYTCANTSQNNVNVMSKN